MLKKGYEAIFGQKKEPAQAANTVEVDEAERYQQRNEVIWKRIGLEWTDTVQNPDIPMGVEKTILAITIYFRNVTHNGPELMSDEEVLKTMDALGLQCFNEGRKDELEGPYNDLKEKVKRYLKLKQIVMEKENNEEIEDEKKEKLKTALADSALRTNCAAAHILSQVRVIDIHLLYTLIMASRLAGGEVTEKKKKRALLIVGPTGVGKSTLVPFLAGLSFEKVGDHIRPLYPNTNTKLETALKTFESSPYAESCTAAINHITFENMGVYGCGKSDEYDSETLDVFDPPGFNETRSCEYQIANAVSIASAVSDYGFVKLLVMFCKSDGLAGSRGQGIKDTLSTLISLVGNIHDHIPTFAYGYSKWELLDHKLDNEAFRKRQIALEVDNIRNHLNYCEMVTPLRQMLDHMSSQPPMVLDPMVDTSCSSVMKYLLHGDKFIREPHLVFKDFVSDKHVTLIQRQVDMNCNAISHALGCINKADRKTNDATNDAIEDVIVEVAREVFHNVHIIEYRMQHLLWLCECNIFPEKAQTVVSVKYDDCKTKVNKLLINPRTCRLNDLSEEYFTTEDPHDITDKLSCLLPELAMLESLRAVHFGGPNNLYVLGLDRIQGIGRQLQEELRCVLRTWKDNINTCCKEELKRKVEMSVLIVEKLDKLPLSFSQIKPFNKDLKERGEELERITCECKHLMNEYFADAEELAKKSFESEWCAMENVINPLVASWDVMKSISEEFFWLEFDFETRYKASVKMYVSSTVDKCTAAGELISESPMARDINRLYETYITFLKLHNYEGVVRHVHNLQSESVMHVKEIVEGIFTSAVGAVKKLLPAIKACFVSEKISIVEKLNSLKTNLEVVDCLMKFDSDKSCCASYDEAMKQVQEFITSSQKVISKSLSNIDRGEVLHDRYFVDCTIAICNLKGLEMFAEHTSGLFNGNVLHCSCRGRVMELVISLAKALEKTEFSISPESIAPMYRKLLQLERILALYDDDMPHDMKRIKATFISTLVECIAQEEKSLQSVEVESYVVKRVLVFCSILADMKIESINQLASRLHQSLKKAIEAFVKRYEDKLCTAYAEHLKADGCVTSHLDTFLKLMNELKEYQLQSNSLTTLNNEYSSIYDDIFGSMPNSMSMRLEQTYFCADTGIVNQAYKRLLHKVESAKDCSTELDILWECREEVNVHTGELDRFMGNERKFDVLKIDIINRLKLVRNSITDGIDDKVSKKMYKEAADDIVENLHEDDKLAIENSIHATLEKLATELTHRYNGSLAISNLNGRISAIRNLDSAIFYLHPKLRDTELHKKQNLVNILGQAKREMQLSVVRIVRMFETFLTEKEEVMSFVYAENVLEQTRNAAELCQHMDCLKVGTAGDVDTLVVMSEATKEFIRSWTHGSPDISEALLVDVDWCLRISASDRIESFGSYLNTVVQVFTRLQIAFVKNLVVSYESVTLRMLVDTKCASRFLKQLKAHIDVHKENSYIISYDTVSESIIGKMTAGLDFNIKSETDSLDAWEDRIDLVAELQNEKYMPESVYGHVTEVLILAKAELKKNVDRENAKIKAAVALDENVRELLSLFRKYDSKRWFKLAIQAENEVISVVTGVLDLVKDLIQKNGSMVRIFETLGLAWVKCELYLKTMSCKFENDARRSKDNIDRERKISLLRNTLKADAIKMIQQSNVKFLFEERSSFKSCKEYFYPMAAAMQFFELAELEPEELKMKECFEKVVACFEFHERSFTFTLVDAVKKDNITTEENKYKDVGISSNLYETLGILLAISLEDSRLFTDVKGFCSDNLCKAKFPECTKAFSVLSSYKELVQKVVSKVEKCKFDVDVPFLENELTRSINDVDWLPFYMNIFRCLSFIYNAGMPPLVSHLADIDPFDIKKQCISHICEQLDLMKKRTEGQLLLISKVGCAVEDYKQFYYWLSNIRSCMTCADVEFKIDVGEMARTCLSVQTQFEEMVHQLCESFVGATISKKANILIRLKRMAIYITTYVEDFNKKINDLLLGLGNTENFHFSDLANYLKNDDVCSVADRVDGICKRIVNEHDVFVEYALKDRRERTRLVDFDTIMDGLIQCHADIDNPAKERLRSLYNDLVSKHLDAVFSHREDISAGIAAVTTEVKGAFALEQEAAYIKLNLPASSDYHRYIVDILTRIFVCWTLDKSREDTNFPTTKTKQDLTTTILQPHAVQVISIFLMLGLDRQVDQMRTYTWTRDDVREWLLEVMQKKSNHLVQLGTGEGKTVVLGVISILCALLGFKVDVACYSHPLVQRDALYFHAIFTAFQVSNEVSYGTFNNLCENVINEKGNVRELVEARIGDGVYVHEINPPSNRPRILFFDEVDMYFKEDFYGNMYRPLAALKDKQHGTVLALVKHAWKNRNNREALRGIHFSGQYQACIARYPGWEFLVEEAIKDMVAVLGQFSGSSYVPDHVVDNGEIGYVKDDAVSLDTRYGFRSVFAHFYERERRQITEQVRDSNTFIPVVCGTFSYGEIPRRYQCIMGVSGTVAQLCDEEHKLLEDKFAIRKYTIMPSAYGDANIRCAFDRRSMKDVQIVSAAEHCAKIVEEMESRLRGTTQVLDHGKPVLGTDGTPLMSVGDRAVFIFFESSEEMKAFYESPELAKHKPKVHYLDQTTTLDNKNAIIKTGMSRGSIVLLHRAFGRGYDFECYERELMDYGGMHVIQTFVTLEESEEVQMRGRTARQGDIGSYSMVLREDSLMKLLGTTADVFAKDLQSAGSPYALIHARRRKKFVHKFKERIADMHLNGIPIEKFHKDSIAFVDSLVDKQSVASSDEHVVKFLRDNNKANMKYVRTVVLMDGTNSMAHALEAALKAVSTMFGNVNTILEEHRLNNIIVEIKFLVYRNYNSPASKIIQQSEWFSHPSGLVKFLKGVKAEGGQGREAIELGLAQVCKEDVPVDQVILIGDMAPNNNDDVVWKRRNYDYVKKEKWLQFSHSDEYWDANTDIIHTKDIDNKHIYFEDQMKKIIEKKIPVNAYYIYSDWSGGEEAKEYNWNAVKASFEGIADRSGGVSALMNPHSVTAAEDLEGVVSTAILEKADSTGGLVQAYYTKFGARGHIKVPNKLGLQLGANK